MTDARQDQPRPVFSLRTIGPEPSGATPLDPEDLEGLIPDFMATRADLNVVEFENIAKALPRALQQARTLKSEGVLAYRFMMDLHRRMFGDVWAWAETPRQREANIGVVPRLIPSQSMQTLDDAKYWHANRVFEPDDLAARIHCRLVSVHPFVNGNGRCTRLMADLYLASIGASPFTWGGADLDVDGSGRAEYIAALVKAVGTDNYEDLMQFARA
ncbi:MAG: mobile mystery protein B [Streptosporangiaceae bacterium]